MVTAASVSDTAAGVTLLSRIAGTHPRIRTAWVDAGHRTTAIDHCARLGIDVHPVQRDPGVKGFKVIPRRWTIERSIGCHSCNTAASPATTSDTRTTPRALTQGRVVRACRETSRRFRLRGSLSW
ncbi:hypothetical protein ACFWD7_55835 [Streptomyces mirabilis]|uniref:hypothetical protein n=1 Tax=Streptomyces mirabilis TaxID=68239 RepID=UPI0036B6F3AF